MSYPSLPVNNFRYQPQIILRGVSSNISKFAIKRPVGSSTLRWNISRYLATTTCGLTKNSKIQILWECQAPLHPIRHHIVSDPLEYWHLMPVFWPGHIMLLSYCIMPYSNPNSSLSSGLGTKNGIECRPFWKLWLLGWVNVASVTQMLHHKHHYVRRTKKRCSKWKWKTIISNNICASEGTIRLKWMPRHTLPWKRRNSIISL